MLSVSLFFYWVILWEFFLVIIDRLPKNLSPWTGRSKCDSCGHILHARDLIPVLSFLISGGKCRYCHTTLSSYYPLLEITTGIFFALTPLLLSSRVASGSQGYWVELIYTLFILSTFIIVFFIDLKYGIIPFIIVLPATLLACIYHAHPHA